MSLSPMLQKQVGRDLPEGYRIRRIESAYGASRIPTELLRLWSVLTI
jgi:hypothetical protein